MSTMTWEKIRDHHLGKVAYYTDENYPRAIQRHQAMADFITDHLAQPAQAVDVVAWRWRDDVRPGLPWHTTTDADVIQQMEATGGYEIEPLTRALSGEKAGPVGGWVSLRVHGARSPSCPKIPARQAPLRAGQPVW